MRPSLMSGAQIVEKSLPVTIMGTRFITSASRHSCPILTRVGLSARFISVPTTIWLFTVICVFSAHSDERLLRSRFLLLTQPFRIQQDQTWPSNFPRKKWNSIMEQCQINFQLISVFHLPKESYQIDQFLHRGHWSSGSSSSPAQSTIENRCQKCDNRSYSRHWKLRQDKPYLTTTCSASWS